MRLKTYYEMLLHNLNYSALYVTVWQDVRKMILRLMLQTIITPKNVVTLTVKQIWLFFTHEKIKCVLFFELLIKIISDIEY